MSKLYHGIYNPDVLTCLANLSNDEVFTPPEVANQILDLLPLEIWRDKTATLSGGNKPSSDGKYQVISSLKVLFPNEACSETYLVLAAFNSVDEANNMGSYVATNFFKFLLLQSLTSIHITKDKFLFVPVQDFSKSWIDKELYAKYNLAQKKLILLSQ